MKKVNKTLAIVSVSALMFSTPLLAEEWQGEAKDAWLDGKIEMSLFMNESLNDYTIDAVVKDGVVTLVGVVATEAEREEAAKVASVIDGVVSVDNKIELKPSLKEND